MAFAGDLHLRGEGVHAVAARSHHGFEQVPTVVRREFEQAFIDGGQGDLGTSRRQAAFRRAHLDAGFGFFANLVAGAVSFDFDFQLMRALADFDAGDTEFETGAAEVDQCGWLDLVVATAHHQRGDENVRRPAGFHRDVEYR